MNELKVSTKDDIVMKLLHYFITEEDYRPILLRGADNEIWLENMDASPKIIRINTKYLHNNEQFEFDLRKTKSIMKNIKKKTLSLNMDMLNIVIDANENVKAPEDKNINTVIAKKISDLKKNKLIKSVFPKFEKISGNKCDPVEMMALTEEINQKTLKEEKKLSKIFKSKDPIITKILIATNIIVFLLMFSNTIYNFMISNFGVSYVSLQKGNFYTLITSGFIHANILHLFFNMYALTFVGKEVEKYYGKVKYILIYFISMIIGGLFASAFSDSLGIGASGAIFGLFGALLFFSYNYRSTIEGLLRSPITATIVVNLILGFIIPNVGVFAHIGGLIGGFLVSMALGIETRENKTDKINATIVIIIASILLLTLIFIK